MTQDITLDVAGARVTLPAKTLTDLWLERVKGAPAVRVPAYPKIGHAFPGEAGIYAGLVVGDGNFDADYHLIVLDGDRDDIKWADAKAWAESISGSLPLRKEQAVMFGNVPQLFEKAWYWSSEQCAGVGVTRGSSTSTVAARATTARATSVGPAPSAESPFSHLTIQ